MENAHFILQQWKDDYSLDGDVINSRVAKIWWTKPQQTRLNAMLMPLILEVYHNLGLVLFFKIIMVSSSLQLVD